MWLPVNFDEPESKSAQGKATGPEASRSDVAVPPPASLDTWVEEEYSLTRSAAVSLGFSLGNVDVKGNEAVFVASLERYQEVSASDGTRLRYGAALRLVVHASDITLDGGLNLPVLTAKATLGQATTSTSVLLRGYVGEVNLPEIRVLTVETYADWIASVSKMKDVFKDTANISPVLLAKFPAAPQFDSLSAGVGEVWALAEIAQGRSLRAALQRLPQGGDEDDVVAQGVRDTYTLLVPGGADDAEPTREQKVQAEGHLHGVRVRTWYI